MPENVLQGMRSGERLKFSDGYALTRMGSPYPQAVDYPLFTLKDLGSMGLDLVPGVGDVKSGQEAISGKDLITGQKLNWWQRGLAGVGALPGVPNLGVMLGAAKALKAPLGKVGKADFVKAGYIPVYRGTGKKGFSGLKFTEGGVLGDGVYFYTDPMPARSHATSGGGVITGYIKPEAAVIRGNIAVVKDPSKVVLAGKIPVEETVLTGQDWLKRVDKALSEHSKTGLALAEEMVAKGADVEDIWQSTGWIRGKEGKWRFEIDDSVMKVNRDVEMAMTLGGGKKVKLGELIDHPVLFDNYPEFRDVGVRRVQGKKSHFDVDKNEIVLGSGADAETLIHEIQHSIQSIEGFAKGGSPQSQLQLMVNKKKLADELLLAADMQDRVGAFTTKQLEGPFSDVIMNAWDSTSGKWLSSNTLRQKAQKLLQDIENIDPTGTKDYLKLHGEFEARDSASRLTWGPEERKVVRPYSSEMEPAGGWEVR